MTDNLNEFPEIRKVKESRWLMNYIKNRIYTLRLSSYLSEEDIMQYALCSLYQELKSGKTVQYPIAWAKLVCERYINKQYRKNKNTQTRESSQIEFLANLRSQEIDIHFFDNNEQLHHSIQQLQDSSRKIIEMRFFQQMHWSEIAEILSGQEGKTISEATARKRGERAITRLREIYQLYRAI